MKVGMKLVGASGVWGVYRPSYFNKPPSGAVRITGIHAVASGQDPTGNFRVMPYFRGPGTAVAPLGDIVDTFVAFGFGGVSFAVNDKPVSAPDIDTVFGAGYADIPPYFPANVWSGLDVMVPRSDFLVWITTSVIGAGNQDVVKLFPSIDVESFDVRTPLKRGEKC